MISETLKKAFNFPEILIEPSETLKFFYELEQKNLNRDFQYRKMSNMDELYRILSDQNTITKWCILSPRYFDTSFWQDLSSNNENIFTNNNQLQNQSSYFNELNILFPEVMSEFKEYYPRKQFSNFYKLLYSIIFLYDFTKIYEMNNFSESLSVTKVQIIFEGLLSDVEFGKLFKLIFDIISGNQELNNAKNQFNSLWESYISTIFYKNLQQNDFTQFDRCYILLSLQLAIFTQMLSRKQGKDEELIKNTISVAALAASNYCYQKEYSKEGVLYGKLSLYVEDSQKRQDAYNILGLCAIESNQFQLSYDTYFSWIYKKIVFETENNLQLEYSLNCDLEDTWRTNNSKQVALMYANFAYVCSEMYSLLKNSPQTAKLMSLAEYYLKRAIELDGDNKDCTTYYGNMGVVLYDAKKYSESLEYHKLFESIAENDIEKLNASYGLIFLCSDLLNSEYSKEETDINQIKQIKEELNNSIYNFLKYYDALNNRKRKNSDIIDVLKRDRKLYKLFRRCESISKNEKKDDIRLYLLQIYDQTLNILSSLRRTSYSDHVFVLNTKNMPRNVQELLRGVDSEPVHINNDSKKTISNEIAYYTTLKNALFLFDEISSPDSDCSVEDNDSTFKNCFTMMHARYMNDPEEGLILLQKLAKFLPSSPKELRNQLYDQEYVFIKSFTGLIDQLNMWTLYGSDRASTKDCDGCCICFAPETFDMMIDPSQNISKGATQMAPHENDDYHLYNIAYIDGEDIIVNGTKNPSLKTLYKNLEGKISELAKTSKPLLEADKKILADCLVLILEKIMFLFKDVSYRLEEESRLIVTRDISNRDEINQTNQMPPKLFINPMYQVYPEKIILGPKVENADYWIPYLQYELSKIKDKWPSNLKRKYKPTVRKSRINIR